MKIKINNDQEVEKEIFVAARGARKLSTLSPLRPSSKFIPSLLYPLEKPIPSDLPLQDIEVIYPSGNFHFLGLSLHWLIVYFLLAIAFGFGLKRIVGVEI